MRLRRRESFDARVSGMAALGEPQRRDLYLYVVGRHAPVSRDQAAAGTGLARHVAKFHLDKLVDDGLLDTEFARPPGRGGPGAGRPAKLYRRSEWQLEVSLPERRYDLAGWLLARAVTDAERDGVPVSQALASAARDLGQSVGAEARSKAGSRPSAKVLAAAASGVLEELGYEPRHDSEGIELANCPFHSLAEDYTELICGMNLELTAGVLVGLGRTGLEACPDPAPDRCCVRIRTEGESR